MAASTLDLLPYLSEMGLQRAYEPRDGEVMGQCPAHLERVGKIDAHPSFGFNAEKNIGYCFSCQWRPDLRELVLALTGEAPDAQLMLDVQEAAILRRITERKREAAPL